MEADNELICVNEGLLVLFTRLLGIVETLREDSYDQVRDVKQPETHGKELALDEVSDEESVVGE